MSRWIHVLARLVAVLCWLSAIALVVAYALRGVSLSLGSTPASSILHLGTEGASVAARVAALPGVLALVSLLVVMARLFSLFARGELLSGRTAALFEWVARLVALSVLLAWLTPLLEIAITRTLGGPAPGAVPLTLADLAFFLLSLALLVLARVQRVAVARSDELAEIL